MKEVEELCIHKNCRIRNCSYHKYILVGVGEEVLVVEEEEGGKKELEEELVHKVQGLLVEESLQLVALHMVVQSLEEESSGYINAR